MLIIINKEININLKIANDLKTLKIRITTITWHQPMDDTVRVKVG